jgi:hypothetical protein
MGDVVKSEEKYGYLHTNKKLNGINNAGLYRCLPLNTSNHQASKTLQTLQVRNLKWHKTTIKSFWTQCCS